MLLDGRLLVHGERARAGGGGDRERPEAPEQLLDVRNRLRRVQPLRARRAAVQDGVALEDRVVVLQTRQALALVLVTRVDDPAVRLQQRRGPYAQQQTRDGVTAVFVRDVRRVQRTNRVEVAIRET